MAREPFLINPAGLGESLVVLGVGNPRRERRATKKRRRTMARRARVRHNDPTRARPRGRRAHRNDPMARRRRHPARRRRVVHSNWVVDRRVKRYNRARVRHVGGGAFAITRPASWMPAVVMTGLGATVSAFAPRIAGPAVTPPVAYLIQAGQGALVATVLPLTGLVRPVSGFFYFVGAFVPIVTDFFQRFVMRWVGLAAYTYETAAELSELGQEPYYPASLSDMDAYAYEGVSDGLAVSPQYSVDAGDEEGMAYGGVGDAGYGSAAPEAPWARAAFVGR
jgi:hypothetical protein